MKEIIFMRFEDLSSERKLLLFIVFGKKAIDYLKDNDERLLAGEVLEKCIEFYDNKTCIGDELYDYIDSATEYDITDRQADAEDIQEIQAWDCIIDSVAYTCRYAYESENKVLPQAIEIATDDFYLHLREAFISIYKNTEKVELVESIVGNTENITIEKVISIL